MFSWVNLLFLKSEIIENFCFLSSRLFKEAIRPAKPVWTTRKLWHALKVDGRD